MLTGWLLAHGVGSRGTLPLPLWQFSWAAIAALVLSFVALGALWQTPKLDSTEAGRVIPGSRGPLLVGEWLLRILGLSLFGLTIGAALFGADVAGESTNVAPVTLYVMVWVAVPIASAFIGDIWRSLNPYRTIGLLFPADTSRQPPDHQWVGVATMVSFLLLELVHPSGDSPRILGWAMVVYSVLMIGGIARFGRSWLDRADGFGILFSLIAGMSPFTTDDSGSLRIRLPLAGLSEIEVRRGTTMLILVVLGGTSFDGFSESSLFTDIIGRPTGWSAVAPKSIGLLVMIGIATVLYWFGARATARVTGIDHEDAADMFTPSLIPIVWAYAVAHYAQLLVDQSQSFLHRLSNPYGRFDAEGAPTTDWFGTASDVVNLNVVDVDLIAWIQAMAIVVGHVLAVLYAHDLAVSRFAKRDAMRSQQTMLVVMVLYSVAGLWLLFAG